MPMTRQWKKLIIEMAIIVMLAVTVGIVWNHGLLRDVYYGKLPESNPGPAHTAAPGAGPLPAGLMQARELFEGKGAVFIDAREASAYREGHIRGAVSLPVGEFDARMESIKEKLPTDATLVIYCSGFGCKDSKILGEKLAKRGYVEILIFEGGLPEWKDAGLPVEGSGQ